MTKISPLDKQSNHPTTDIRPSDYAKMVGLDDLTEMAFLTQQSIQTLTNWFKNPKKRALFNCAAKGAAVEKRDVEVNGSPIDVWLYGLQARKHRFEHNPERMQEELVEWARECIQRFPDPFERMSNDIVGTPRYILTITGHL